MTIARELAAFVTRQASTELPGQAIEHAAMLIASTIASAALGSTLQSTRIIRALEVERGGEPEARLWFGAAEQLPIAAAARVNALASDAAASDDSHLDFIIHHGTTACATALAVGERTGSSGADVLAAIVLGYEVTSRLITAMHFPFKAKGFHGCIVAGFAGAVAAARLLRLDETQTTHAIALAATSIGGLSAAANTSWAREYHAGQAAAQGVQAALAASRGFTVEEVTISRPGYQGFANPHLPTDLVGIAHSAMYFAAAGVVDRDYTWAHAFEDKINDPRIRAMLGKVRMIEPPTQHLERFRCGAIVTIGTRDGRSHSDTVHAPRGSSVLGIAWSDVEAKYRALVPYARLGGDNMERSLAVIRNFRNARQVSELTGLLR